MIVTANPPVSSEKPDVQCSRFELAHRWPYDAEQVFDFLAARATAGVESVDGNCYRRTITVDAQHGTISVSPHASAPALVLEATVPDPQAMPTIVARVRRIFDLDADPAAIAERLGHDPLLREALRKHPGIRMPGAWDPFELAVRAIVGQQVSVRAATTIAGRIASLFGSAVADDRGLTRLFPTPAELARAPLERAGVMPTRADTIRTLARRVAAGTIAWAGSAAPQATLSALTRVPGIGDWTAQYVAMRGFGEPDAFPSGDLILRRAAGGCTARELERKSDAWRPFRAYAVMLLWQRANDAASSKLRRGTGFPGSCLQTAK